MANPKKLVQDLRNSFESGKTLPLEYRLKQLRSLKRMYEENVEVITAALYKDLHKSKFEALLWEVQYLINDVEELIHNLPKWAKPERPPKSTANILDSLYIFSEPYGVVLVVGAWNYPIELTLSPVAGAIAAGNCVIIKPPNLASNCTNFMTETIPKYLDKDCCRIFKGSVADTTELLKERFDYIFYTGSTQVGRVIHEAANKFLTPVTLELGGKSSVYMDDSVDVNVAAKRILWGKFVNSGQTCVAPDYMLCTPSARDKFLKVAKNIICEFYGQNPQNSPDYGRIIGPRQFERVKNLLKGAKIVIGGNYNAADLYIEPTIVTDVKPDDPLMQDEIFGPILPILTVDNVQEAIQLIKSIEKPLALYIFSNKKKDIDLLIRSTSTGGVAVNDTLMQMATENLPFGGVGLSGMGAYHGKLTFDTFSHKKSCLYRNLGGLGEKIGSARYPPYSDHKLKILGFVMKNHSLPVTHLKIILVLTLGVAASVYYSQIKSLFN